VVAVLALTASSLTWGVMLLVGLALSVAWAVAFARPRPAAMLGCLLVIGVLTAPIVFQHASLVAGATGRSGAQLQATSANRRDAWRRVGERWSAKPLLGYGPGQSSVLLAYRPDPGPGGPPKAPVVLGSAQGLWGASLLDTGLVGLAAWLFTLGGLFGFALQALLRRAESLAWAAFAAAGVATLLGQLAGDRLDLKVWLLLGLMTAASQPPDGAGDRLVAWRRGIASDEVAQGRSR
jgi:O-antigen ligase